jgi:adhesin transport system outer membrane protein
VNVDAAARLSGCCFLSLLLSLSLLATPFSTTIASAAPSGPEPDRSARSGKAATASAAAKSPRVIRAAAKAPRAIRATPALKAARSSKSAKNQSAAGGKMAATRAQVKQTVARARRATDKRAADRIRFADADSKRLSTTTLATAPPRNSVRSPAAAPSADAQAPAGAPSVDGVTQLHSLARIAAGRSAALREAMAGSRAAALDVREAEGARLPQVSLDVTSSHTSGGGIARTSESRGSPHYALTGSMPIYDWGRNARVIDSRGATWRAAGARLDGTLESLTLETAVAALEFARARAAVEAVNGYLGNMQRLVDMLVRITREDPGRRAEVTQARARVLQAEVTRSGLLSRVRESGIALERLAGSADVPTDAIAAAFAIVPPLDQMLADVPEQPLLRQLDAEQLAQSNLAEALRSARRPQIGIVASHSPVSPGLTDGYASYAGVTVSVPLYRGFSDVAAQRAAGERADGAGERRQQAETDLASRLRTLHQSATTLLARDDEFIALLKESDQVRRGFFEQWYQMGRRSLFELLAAENEHYGLQAARLNTRFDGLAANARLRGEGGTLARWIGLRA